MPEYIDHSLSKESVIFKELYMGLYPKENGKLKGMKRLLEQSKEENQVSVKTKVRANAKLLKEQSERTMRNPERP